MDRTEGNASLSKAFWGGIAASIKDLLGTWYYTAPLAIALIGSYGYYLTHYAISEDDLIFKYFPNGGEAAEGRPVWSLLSKILNLQGGGPWFEDFIGIALLFLAATLLCALIRHFSDKHVSLVACSIFACVLVTYPMYSDMFCYPDAAIRNSFTLLIGTLAVCFFYISSQTGRKGPYAIGVLFIFAITGWYEIGGVTFVLIAMMIAFVRFIFDKNKEWKFGKFFKEMFVFYALPVIIGVAAMELLVFAYMHLLNIEVLNTAGKQILWGTADTKTVLTDLIKGIFFLYFAKAPFYLPIAVFDIALMACIVSSILQSARSHSAIPVVLVIVTIGSLVAFSIFQGKTSYYRTMSQPFSLFCAFIAAMFIGILQTKQARRGIIATSISLLFLLAFWQTSDISHWFGIECQRSDEETTAIANTGQSIYANFDSSKPVICVGSFKDSDYLLDQEFVKADDWRLNLVPGWRNIDGFSPDKTYVCKIQQSNMQSVITWSTKRTMKSHPGQALCDYFSLCGYPITPGNKAEYEDAKSKVETGNIPEFPKQGYIVDEGDYILVNF